MISAQDITGLILAGGRGSRMGGVDKGLQSFNGFPLAANALMRLAPQVGEVMINANRNIAAYESMGVPVWPDVLPDYAGPLAGLLTGLERSESPFLAAVPCDSPLFPLDLVQRLARALEDEQADLAVAATIEDGVTRRHPVFCLLRAELTESLARFTHGGQHKVGAWIAQHQCAEVVFEDARAFANANTLDDLHRLRSHV